MRILLLSGLDGGFIGAWLGQHASVMYLRRLRRISIDRRAGFQNVAADRGENKQKENDGPDQAHFMFVTEAFHGLSLQNLNPDYCQDLIGNRGQTGLSCPRYSFSLAIA